MDLLLLNSLPAPCSASKVQGQRRAPQEEGVDFSFCLEDVVLGLAVPDKEKVHCVEGRGRDTCDSTLVGNRCCHLRKCLP